MNSKKTLTAFFAVLFLLFAGCKKDTFEEITGICPIVLSTDPDNGEVNVPVNKAITVTFNGDMNPATINATSLTITGPSAVTGTITVSGAVATFTPSSPLADNTTYTGVVKTTVKDLMGNALQEDYIWTFSTGSDIRPMVAFTDPDDGDIGVVQNKNITATFNMPMNPATINGTTFTVRDSANAITGTVTYNGLTATFNPTSDLDPLKTYTATITTGVNNTSGNAMAANYTWSFTTGSISPPTVVSTDPANNATNVALDKNITATFSEAMAPLTITGTSFLLRDGATPIPGVVTYSGFVATFNPTVNLVAGKTYTATIKNTVTDLDGTPMTNDYVWTFSTGAIILPLVATTDPEDGETDVVLNKTITATFNMTMNAASINNTTFTIKDGGTAVLGVVSYNGLTATFNPVADLLPGKVYTGTITTGATNTTGGALAANYTWTFTTGAVSPPTVVTTSPLNNETGVLLDRNITATFNEAMAPLTINASSFLLRDGAIPITGTVTYSGVVATFNPTVDLVAGKTYTATIKNTVTDLDGTPMTNDFVWIFKTPVMNTPRVVSTDPANLAVNVPIGKTIAATFSEAMNGATINTASFKLQQGGNPVAGVVNYSGLVATFNPVSDLLPGTKYTATITTGAQNLAGTGISNNYVWTFTTAAPSGPAGINLDCVAGYAIIGGSAVTNTGPSIVSGDLGLSPGTSVTGFPPGTVINGAIRINDIETNNAKLCLTAAYNDAAGRTLDVIIVSDGQLGGKTFAPGLYRSAMGSFAITGSDFTLNAMGNVDAVWIFQMPSSTLTVGNNIKVTLINGAQAKNIYWQVGTSATIGTYAEMKGNILSDQSITIMTGASLLGRALTRIAAITLDNNAVTKP